MSTSRLAKAGKSKRSLLKEPSKTSTRESSADLIRKTKIVISSEYSKEIQTKESQVYKLDEQISKTKHLLHQLRYCVVSDFYQRPKRDDEAKDKRTASSPASTRRKLRKLSNDSVQEILQHNMSCITEKSRVTTNSNPASNCNNQTKHLIVVGNTSKYIGMENPSDSATHKWVIYVISKSTVPIEKMLSKVRFFLHASYKPEDVVELKLPPFQIARRGWGEFPVRIQLLFHPHVQHKPLQFTHNLVLDKTLTGLQTMGAETLVEIWLKDGSFKDASSDAMTKIPESKPAKGAQDTIRSPPVVVPQENTHIDQLKTLKSFARGKPKQVFQRDGKMYIVDPLQTRLKKQSLLKPQVSLLRSQSPRSTKLPHIDHDYIKLSSSNDHNFTRELEFQFESIKFVDPRYAIDFLLRKLPLVSPKANDCYPFIVPCLEDYRKLGLAKRFTHEWLRAKYIAKCISRHSSLKKGTQWTTKEVFVYARKYPYLPVIQNVGVLPIDDRPSAFSNSPSMTQTLSSSDTVYSFITSIDSKIDKTHPKAYKKIIDVHQMNSQSNKKIDTTQLQSVDRKKLFMGIHDNLETESLLVNSLTHDIGIRLENESIGSNVSYPACQTILAQSLKLFLNDLLRFSLTENADSIQLKDVLQAINSSPRLDFISNRHLGVLKAKVEKNNYS